MRTTITLSDEAVALVTLYATARGVSRSQAVSDLILRAPQQSRVKLVDGVPILDLPDKGKTTSFEDVKRLESEGY